MRLPQPWDNRLTGSIDETIARRKILRITYVRHDAFDPVANNGDVNVLFDIGSEAVPQLARVDNGPARGNFSVIGQIERYRLRRSGTVCIDQLQLALREIQQFLRIAAPTR